MTPHLLMLWNGNELECLGPYPGERQREFAATVVRRDHGPDHGRFRIDGQWMRVEAYVAGFCLEDAR